MGLPKNRRLRRSAEFRRVFRRGRRARDRFLSISVAAAPSKNPDVRYGFSVSKRVGNAVVRNRVKRRLRAIAKSMPNAPGADVVITAYPDAAHSTYGQLSRSVNTLAKKLGVGLSSKDSDKRLRSHG